MVRVDADMQSVLAVQHSDTQAMLMLALAAQKQGRALGWANNALLLADDAALAQHLQQGGFTSQLVQGELSLTTQLNTLPAPTHACGHEPHTHDHGHAHAHQPHSHTH
jgi:hypothetical protein